MADEPERTFEARDSVSRAKVTVEVYPDGTSRIFSEGPDETIDLDDADTERFRLFLNGKNI